MNLFKNNKQNQEVTCLGKTFSSEDERREYFRDELRKALPELKKLEGFPIGEDEDIIALSDPPYYTACPNPWLNDFISEWEKEKESILNRKDNFHVASPYASDVSEGKNNPIYNAHSYHTKVPHPAIMRYILHYTQPGDIIFDGFAGTGMTGVAAQLCGNPDSELKTKIEREFKEMNLSPPVWGARKAICGDLSPIASFIAYNYNTPVDVEEFKREAERILKEVEQECGWMYETNHKPTPNSQIQKGKINYTVWSDVFICSNCSGEIVFWNVAVDHEVGKVKDEFECNHCRAKQTKRNVSKAMATVYDSAIGQTIQQAKTVPVLINYSVGKSRFNKSPDSDDLALIKKIDEMDIPYWFPTDKLPKGDKMGDPLNKGITNVHHFYTKKALNTLSYCYNLAKLNDLKKYKMFFIEQATLGMSKMARYVPTHYSQVNQYLSGTLYVGSQVVDVPPSYILNGKIKKLPKLFESINQRQVIYTQSSNVIKNIKNNSIDYIFTDPPFGANIMYSELNFLWESWLKVKTNNKTEAIENKTQGKSFLEYQDLMYQCFKEYYRVLKPGKWMTVEFSNTSAAVWNGIQTAIQKAGFVVANVAALDKQQGSFNAVTNTTSVKQDLVISCYKPSEEFDVLFHRHEGEVAVWDFINEHLNHLPIHVSLGKKTTAVIERSAKILYDRLVSFYIVRNLPVPLDVKDFQDGLKKRYVERDGMFFTQEQIDEYETKKAQTTEVLQYALIVTTESEGIEWLKRELSQKPMTYQDIQPKWMKAITAVRKGDILPELKEILTENFIQESDKKWRIPDMNEAKDREIMRNKVLHKEFQEYVEQLNLQKVKKLKEVRMEALRAGFKLSWEKKEFQTIVMVAEKIPQSLLLEDEQLLMLYDIAKDKV